MKTQLKKKKMIEEMEKLIEALESNYDRRGEIRRAVCEGDWLQFLRHLYWYVTILDELADAEDGDPEAAKIVEEIDWERIQKALDIFDKEELSKLCKKRGGEE